MQFGIREIIFTSVLLGLVAGTYATIVEPHARARQQQQAQMRAMDEAIATLANSSETFLPLAQRVRQQAAAAALFRSRLPGEADTARGVDEILQTASANSLQAGEALLLKPTELEGVRAQPIDLHLTGNFNGFYSFLLQLESMPRVTRITKLNLKGTNDTDGQIQADMTLTMYFAAGPKGVDGKQESR